MNKIQIIQGGQWGSEAKGAVAAEFAIRDNIDFAVRTGATNAGHTVYYRGKPYKMQQLPVGWVNPTTKLVIGAGALVDMAILNREIALITEATGEDVRKRLFIDPRAVIHRSFHAKRSAESGRHHAMGATGKGCSEALIDRIRLRGKEEVTLGKLFRDWTLCEMVDTEALLNNVFDSGASIQLEATQGTLLDLCLGPWPYVTHKQCGPAQWMMEAGLSPALPTDIVMVLRTYPIRVAGNSGPMMHEISWPLLARAINNKLKQRGYGPRVTEAAITAFEAAVREAHHLFPHPPDAVDGLDQHLWSDANRAIYTESLSELHKAALSTLSHDVIAELGNLFEMTTVTRKLRRVAQLSMSETLNAVRQVRPHRIVVTFLNYLFPHYWGKSFGAQEDEKEYLSGIEDTTRTPISDFSRGPEGQHIIPYRI